MTSVMTLLIGLGVAEIPMQTMEMLAFPRPDRPQSRIYRVKLLKSSQPYFVEGSHAKRTESLADGTPCVMLRRLQAISIMGQPQASARGE
jgi:hypothetical protein